MKILILSTCGRSGEAEDTSRLNLYLASLKKHVVPYFETKVILLNTCNSNQKTIQRVRDFGLEDVVDVRSIDMMELPQRSLEYWHTLNWYPRVPLNMNMLFDYAKRNNCFEAEWIFHVDTDLEYLDNFKDNLAKIHPLTTINSKVVITLAGDTFPHTFGYVNDQYILGDPPRINLYDEEEDFSKLANVRNIIKKTYTRNQGYEDKFVFHVQQQKNRNDFFGMSRETVMQHTFNWSHASFQVETDKELKNIWDDMSPNKFLLSLSQDKGSLVHELLQSGHLEISRVTLRVSRDMTLHHGPGWSTVDMAVQSDWDFRNISKVSLEENYTEFKNIWVNDYEV